MTTPPARPIFQKLGFQIAFLLAAVLLPLTAISMANSLRAIAEMRARSEAALTGETMAASAKEARLIEEGRGVAAALAAMIGPLLADNAQCSATLARIVAAQPQYSQISFVPKNGQLRCSSSGKQLDVSDSPIFQQFVKSARPGFAVSRNGRISGTSVLGITQPVFNERGDYLGYVAISLPHSQLDITLPESDPTGLIELMTFDRNGEILVASGGLDQAAGALPRDRSLVALMGEEPLAFSALSVDGKQKVYSVVPLVKGELYALGTWPATVASSFRDPLVSVPLLLPMLTFVVSLVVAWLSVEWLVNRHIRRLNTSIKSFAGGDRTITNVNAAGAPLEIREMAQGFERMTDSVMRDEAELEDTLHQKEVLLREVHHRVKNNLQMIASILNMHVRKARTAETRDVVTALQGRVMSLATVHRELYQTSGVGDVHAAELLDAIARQIVSVTAGPERRIDLRIQLDDIHMTPDQAVSLALLAAEGLMIGVRHAASALELRLTRHEHDSVEMAIAGMAGEGDLAAAPPDEEAMALSGQLMGAFAMQLGGRLEQSLADGRYRLTVEFRLRPLAEAENRHASLAPSPG